MTPLPANLRTANALSFFFAMVIVVYAASGPISEAVRWFIEATTADFEELSRRDQRLLFREHWLGAAYKGFERSVFLPTGLILGLPVLISSPRLSSQHRCQSPATAVAMPNTWPWMSALSAASRAR